MRVLLLVSLILTLPVGCNHAPTPSSAPANTDAKPMQPGRFVLYTGSNKGEPTYLVDSALGHVWAVREGKGQSAMLVPIPMATSNQADPNDPLGLFESPQTNGAKPLDWSKYPPAK